MKPSPFGLVVVAIAGCGSTSSSQHEPQPAYLADVCGGAGPHRVLELDESEVVSDVGMPVFDGRRYYVVGPRGSGDTNLFPSTTTVYSTGLCGEDPRTIATDVFEIFEKDTWPGKLLGCTDLGRGDMVLLDPEGVAAPKVVFSSPGCAYEAVSEWGLLGWAGGDPGSATVVLLPFPDRPEDGPVAAVTVIDGLAPPIDWRPGLSPAGELFVIDDTNRLLRLQLPDGDPVVEQERVADFALSQDGTVIVWQDAKPTGSLGRETTGIVRVRYLDAGDEVELGDGTAIAASPLTSPFVRMLLGGAGAGKQRLFDPQTRDQYDVEFTGVLEQIPDGRWIDTGPDFTGPFFFVDFETGGGTPLTYRKGDYILDDDAMILFEKDTFDPAVMAPLWRIPYDGSDEQLLANRVTFNYIRYPDGRILTAVDAGADGIGDLVVIDPKTLDERPVDTDVAVDFDAWSVDGGLLDPPEVVYGVNDGARSGVWRAKLAPG